MVQQTLRGVFFIRKAASHLLDKKIITFPSGRTTRFPFPGGSDENNLCEAAENLATRGEASGVYEISGRLSGLGHLRAIGFLTGPC